MSDVRILFVHGRAQGGRSAEEIREEWLAALREGLGDRSSILDGRSIDLPFYGDELDRLVSEAAAGIPADLAVRGDVAGIDPEFLQFQYEVFEEARRQEGLSDDQIKANMAGDHLDRGPLNWRWVQAIMRTLNRVPGLDGDLIERFTRDVWIYLERSLVRKAVNRIVADQLRPGTEIVLVAHSLGTVVAYDLLREAAGPDVRLFLTMGSPLGIGAIRKRVSPLRHPPAVRAWFNARDRRDVVSLYPLSPLHFAVTPAVTNYDDVRNRSDNAHHISGYLNDSAIAEQIYNALR
jgi:hypothetical protein